MKRRWGRYSRFDETPEDPQASLVNLVDIMLVFICALIVALVSAQPQLFSTTAPGQVDGQPGAPQQTVQQGKELADLPDSMKGQQGGAGMEPVGQVSRDPKTGKLILVGP